MATLSAPRPGSADEHDGIPKLVLVSLCGQSFCLGVNEASLSADSSQAFGTPEQVAGAALRHLAPDISRLERSRDGLLDLDRLTREHAEQSFSDMFDVPAQRVRKRTLVLACVDLLYLSLQLTVINTVQSGKDLADGIQDKSVVGAVISSVLLVCLGVLAMHRRIPFGLTMFILLSAASIAVLLRMLAFVWMFLLFRAATLLSAVQLRLIWARASRARAALERAQEVFSEQRDELVRNIETLLALARVLSVQPARGAAAGAGGGGAAGDVSSARVRSDGRENGSGSGNEAGPGSPAHNDGFGGVRSAGVSPLGRQSSNLGDSLFPSSPERASLSAVATGRPTAQRPLAAWRSAQRGSRRLPVAEAAGEDQSAISIHVDNDGPSMASGSTLQSSTPDDRSASLIASQPHLVRQRQRVEAGLAPSSDSRPRSARRREDSSRLSDGTLSLGSALAGFGTSGSAIDVGVAGDEEAIDAAKHPPGDVDDRHHDAADSSPSRYAPRHSSGITVDVDGESSMQMPGAVSSSRAPDDLACEAAVEPSDTKSSLPGPPNSSQAVAQPPAPEMKPVVGRSMRGLTSITDRDAGRATGAPVLAGVGEAVSRPPLRSAASASALAALQLVPPQARDAGSVSVRRSGSAGRPLRSVAELLMLAGSSSGASEECEHLSTWASSPQ